jgi:hypothetical protein
MSPSTTMRRTPSGGAPFVRRSRLLVVGCLFVGMHQRLGDRAGVSAALVVSGLFTDRARINSTIGHWLGGSGQSKARHRPGCAAPLGLDAGSQGLPHLGQPGDGRWRAHHLRETWVGDDIESS